MTRRHRKALHYFTLIEMLVVVAIIAILLSLLLPAYRKSNEVANLVVCANSMRQLVLADTTYVDDFNDRLAFSNWGWLEWYDHKAGWLYKFPNNSAPGHVETGLFWPYLNTRAIYHCPRDNEPDVGTNKLTSYMMNGAVNSYGVSDLSHRLEQFNASDVLFFELDDVPDTPMLWNDGSSYPWEVAQAIGQRHIDIAVLGHFDGHVVTIATYEYFTMLAQNPGPLWCAPE